MADNGLTVYGAVPNATELITMMGNAIHQSGMLGCENPAQGMVLAMTCFSKGSDPMSLSQRYHIIHGKLAMKADAMLAEFRNRGGKHKIIKRSADEAVLQLTLDGDTQEFSFCWSEAQREPFIYNGKESEALRMIETGNPEVLKKHLKSKYSTPRARMQMLWARVVSDGVRAMCPEVNLGTYTPEEIDDFPESTRAEPPAECSTVAASSPAAGPSEDIEDAEYQPVDPDAGKITGPQLARITELFKALDMPPEKQLASAQKRDAESVATLTTEKAADLLHALEDAYRKVLNTAAGQSRSDGEAMGEPIDAPISQQNIDKIKTLIGELVQLPGNSDIVERMQAKLAKHGIAKFSDLTESSARKVIEALAVKNLAGFFALDLQAAAAKND